MQICLKIHQKIESRYFGFAGQTYNYRGLYVSPIQSTFCSKFTFRAWPHIVPKSNQSNILILLCICSSNTHIQPIRRFPKTIKVSILYPVYRKILRFDLILMGTHIVAKNIIGKRIAGKDNITIAPD